MKTTFISTVFNEEENILKLLDSLLLQSKLPDEIIIVDGGSTDNTVSRIKSYELRIKAKVKFKFLIKKGNRSVGRNEAIRSSAADIIVCSDAGCILDRDWIENITKPFTKKSIDVVAGYYKGSYDNIFQKCLIPYVLLMPDKVDPKNFLPATRSVAFKKTIWEKVGGFPEEFSNNEDYVFAKRLKKINANIFFDKNAIVYWLPMKNLRDSFIMFYRFAVGDGEAKIFRPKVAFIFVRYIFGILLLFYAIINKDSTIEQALIVLIILYVVWAIIKNYKYVNDIRSVIYLPLLQIISDIAVICGTVIGIYKIWGTKTTQ